MRFELIGSRCGIVTNEPPKPPPVDLGVWSEPDDKGFITWQRGKTIEEFGREIEQRFKALYPDEKYGYGRFEWFGLNSPFDLRNWNEPVRGWTRNSEIPRNARLICHCEQGANEGYMVRLLLVSEGKETVCIVCGKCFEKDYAWRACRELAELCGLI